MDFDSEIISGDYGLVEDRAGIEDGSVENIIKQFEKFLIEFRDENNDLRTYFDELSVAGNLPKFTMDFKVEDLKGNMLREFKNNPTQYLKYLNEAARRVASQQGITLPYFRCNLKSNEAAIPVVQLKVTFLFLFFFFFLIFF
jgi:hypothetical protein